MVFSREVERARYPVGLLHDGHGVGYRCRMPDCKEAFVDMLTNDRDNLLYTGCTADLTEAML